MAANEVPAKLVDEPVSVPAETKLKDDGVAEDAALTEDDDKDDEDPSEDDAEESDNKDGIAVGPIAFNQLDDADERDSQDLAEPTKDDMKEVKVHITTKKRHGSALLSQAIDLILDDKAFQWEGSCPLARVLFHTTSTAILQTIYNIFDTLLKRPTPYITSKNAMHLITWMQRTSARLESEKKMACWKKAAKLYGADGDPYHIKQDFALRKDVALREPGAPSKRVGPSKWVGLYLSNATLRHVSPSGRRMYYEFLRECRPDGIGKAEEARIDLLESRASRSRSESIANSQQLRKMFRLARKREDVNRQVHKWLEEPEPATPPSKKKRKLPKFLSESASGKASKKKASARGASAQ